jgi:hypothetical protein
MEELNSLKKENELLRKKVKKMESLLEENMFSKCVVCSNYFSGFESYPFIIGCMDIKECILSLHTEGIQCFTNHLNHKFSNPWCTDCIPDNNISRRIQDINTMVVSNIIYNFNDESGSPSPMTRECMDPKLSYNMFLPNISHDEMLKDLTRINIDWDETMGNQDFQKITNYWGGGGRNPFRTELIESSYIVNSREICNELTKEEKIKRVTGWMCGS